MRNRAHLRKFPDADLIAALPATLVELAERFGVARSTVHRRLIRLEAAGRAHTRARYRPSGRHPALWQAGPR